MRNREGDGARRRWSLATFIPITLTVLVGLAMLGLLVARAVLPSDGAGHADGGSFHRLGLVVDPPDPARTNLRAGMVVMAIDGVPVDDLLRHGGLGRSVAVGDVVSYRVYDHGRVREIPVRMLETRIGRALGNQSGVLLGTGLIAAIAAYLFAHRPREPAAAAFLAFGGCLFVAVAGSLFVNEPADLAFRPWLWWLSLQVVTLGFSVYMGGLAHFGLVFPRPARVLAARPLLVLVPYLAIFSVVVVAEGFLLVTGRLTTAGFAGVNELAGVPGTVAVLAGLANVVANLVRARRDRAVRRELRIVGTGLLATVVIFLGANLAEDVGVEVPEPLFLVGLLPLPLTIAYAVLRRGLFDIQAIVNRTITYLVVTAALVGVYAAGIAAVQGLLRISDLTASIPLTALVAVAFAPARLRVQRMVDRLMYGRRDDPYAVLVEVGRGIQASSNPADALQRLVEAVASALRLPHVAVRLGEDATAELVAAAGDRRGEVVLLPLVHQGITLGFLEVSPRSPGEPLGDADLHLLADVAAQAAVATDALRLSDALARSRVRALTASADERARMRRDLHDGLGPVLAGISLQLSAALDRCPPDDAVVRPIVQASEAADLAKAEVRRIIDGMAPIQLDRLGLMAALRALGDQLNADPAAGTPGHPAVTVEGPATLASVAPAVEIGAYRIAAEAMINAHRHSGGEVCAVTARVAGGELLLEIEDDGVGLDGRHPGRRGLGLASMGARANALGGRLEIGSGTSTGTRVAVTIPVQGLPEEEG